MSRIVIYWPSTELSIKRCTCVNKRRNSGSWCTLDNYITRCHRRLGAIPVGVSWREDVELRASGRQMALGSQWPTVEQPRWERSAAMVRRTLGQYVAVCPCLQLNSHTQPTLTLSRIKCERYIFIKKCVRSFIKVRHYVWLYVMHIYVYYEYTTVCLIRLTLMILEMGG